MEGYRAVTIEKAVLELQQFTLREPEDDEVVIRTTKTLISPGTERAFFLALPNAAVKYPSYPGYNHVGVVVQVGIAVTDLSVGDRVVSTSSHASHIVTRAARCHRVPDSLPDEEAVFFQLLTITEQAVRKTRVEIGEATAVFGAGLIGLLAMQVARTAGALPLIVIDQMEDRLKIASQLGADHTFTPRNDLADVIQDAIGGNGPAVVVEATGNPDVIPITFQVSARLGRVVLLGSTRGETTVNFYRDVHKKGLTIIGAHIDTCAFVGGSSPGWWTLRDEQSSALKLLAHHRVNIQPLISHRFSSEELVDAYDLLARWDQEVIGMVVNWE